jgi:pimeloyl-ACP methyl ester carboxylesterase
MIIERPPGTSLLRRSPLALAALAAAVFVGCTDGGGASPTVTVAVAPSPSAVPSPTAVPMEVPPAVLEWETCSSGFECATINVPLDYYDPSLGMITLPLIRRPATDDTARIGSLLTNPGGPGVSGVDFVRSASTLFSADVRERFDIVGWDPRGVAASDPAVDCVDNLDIYVTADPSPDSVEEQQAQDAAARALAEGCNERSGRILAHLSSANTARDMDRIRAALGDDKLTYLGYSYGTILGAQYAEQFPDRIRAMVLDGAGDPSITPAEDSYNQVVGFETALNAFLADCAADPGCAFNSGGDPGAALDALLDQLDLQPAAGDGDLDVGPGVAWLGIASALYNESSWPVLAGALAAAQAGDGSTLLEFSAFITGRIGPGSYTDEVEQRIAILCVDFQRMTYDEKVALQQRLAVDAPRFGEPGVGPAGDPCDFWPVPSLEMPRRITAPESPPILVVGNTGDPATPYQQAVSLAEQLSQGVLLTLQADSHTAYGGRSFCIDSTVDRYLIDLVPPDDGLTCD